MPGTGTIIANPTTVPAAAAELGVSRQRVLALVTEGRITAMKVGREWIVDFDSVEAYGASRGQQSTIDRPGYIVGIDEGGPGGDYSCKVTGRQLKDGTLEITGCETSRGQG